MKILKGKIILKPVPLAALKKENPSTPIRVKLKTLLVTSSDAQALSYKRLVKAKATK